MSPKSEGCTRFVHVPPSFPFLSLSSAILARVLMPKQCQRQKSLLCVLALAPKGCTCSGEPVDFHRVRPLKAIHDYGSLIPSSLHFASWCSHSILISCKE